MTQFYLVMAGIVMMVGGPMIRNETCAMGVMFIGLVVGVVSVCEIKMKF